MIVVNKIIVPKLSIYVVCFSRLYNGFHSFLRFLFNIHNSNTYKFILVLDWYEVKGGMQDFNYDFTNAMELTIELSCCKYPDRQRLLIEWENNIKSLISYIEEAQKGLRGYVTYEENGNPVHNAKIRVTKSNEGQGIKKLVKTDQHGRYWRILRPGKYLVQAEYDGSFSKEEQVDIPEDGYLKLNFTIKSFQ